ncbi:hypothetical protein Salat_2562100 [Sesamum alatum]|uniref:Glycine-rich protein n=1 Tax=Sesamum alatum TaxID=300844 RepID=A0AAE2CCU3_9LAMI|nr:hypothetical protein Salat_2562100 [Sesamum alatum]
MYFRVLLFLSILLSPYLIHKINGGGLKDEISTTVDFNVANSMEEAAGGEGGTRVGQGWGGGVVVVTAAVGGGGGSDGNGGWVGMGTRRKWRWRWWWWWWWWRRRRRRRRRRQRTQMIKKIRIQTRFKLNYI